VCEVTVTPVDTNPNLAPASLPGIFIIGYAAKRRVANCARQMFRRSSSAVATSEQSTTREISSCRLASETRSSASMIQLVYSSLAKGFDFFSSIETRLRNSFMTL